MPVVTWYYYALRMVIHACIRQPILAIYFLLPAITGHFFLYICIYDRNILALKFIGRRNSLASMHFWIMLIIYLVCR